MSERALVLFSGGQDSTTCLAWALDHFDHVETIGFDYGQRHRVELDCRGEILAAIRRQFPNWAHKLADDHLVEVASLNAISDTALTRDVAITMTERGLPNTFVPGRNILFFALAAAVAYRRDLRRLVGGMCETDYSGYPDCRDDALKALQVALNIGMEQRFVIDTPLMWLNKSSTWRLAHDLGGQPLVDLIVEKTHTCYKGDRGARRDWGYGCGECPACDLRQKGFHAYTT